MFHQNNDGTTDDQQAPAPQDGAWQHPGVPLDNAAAPAQPDQAADAASTWQQAAGDANATAVADTDTATDTGEPRNVQVTAYQAGDNASSSDSGDQQSLGGNLSSIKKQALSQLTPIVNALDQSPEDRFRTLMMMIQAGDDQNLIKAAYDAAGEIGDEKVKAQALLDIVNEIDYFNTQQNQQ